MGGGGGIRPSDLESTHTIGNSSLDASENDTKESKDDVLVYISLTVVNRI